MALSDFLRINLPYGMRKNESGKWFTFNREYHILGFNQVDYVSEMSTLEPFDKLPVYSDFKGLTDEKILKLINENCKVEYNENGSIKIVFFYFDGAVPNTSLKLWNEYQNVLYKLSKFQSK